MTSPTQSTEKSVLDEIRSTIASLDSLRCRSTSSSSSTEPKAANGDVPSTDNTKPSERPGAATAEPAQDRLRQSDSAAQDPATGQPKLKTTLEELEQLDELSNSAATPPKTPTASPVGPSNVVVRNINKDAKIMIVDDERLNIMTFRQHLKQEGYENFVTTDKSTEALVMIRDEQPDVLLLDIQMPEISGLDILRVMGLDPIFQHIPVLILTAETDPKIRRKALDLGASDFLAKPIDPNELLPRVRNAIMLKQHYDMVANEAARLEQQVERRTRQLEATRQQLILSLARAAEHRDDDTGNHVIRVGRYARIVAESIGYPPNKLDMLEQAAQLHDVGKIGIPDSILFKPGRLDPDQYQLIQRHCAIGKQIIEPISERDWEVLKTHTRKGESLLHVRSSPLLMLAARIAQTHHEKWDGSGYPLGLEGEDIPLEGRIVAVADVFDALSSARPYKKAYSRERCFEILEEGRGKHFDPKVLDAFFARADQIIKTQLDLMDEEHKFVDSMPEFEASEDQRR